MPGDKIKIMKFEDKLKSLRVERGLSQENLADAIHVSRSAIAKYENGNGRPSKETLKEIAQYFNVDIHELDDEPNKENSKNNKIVLLISSIGGALLVILSIIAVVLYHKGKISTSAFNLSLTIVLVIFIILLLIGITLITTFVVSMIKHTCHKQYCIIFLSTLIVSLSICFSGYFITKAQYKDYAEFTVEKWANASNNHSYRGVMFNSFTAKYNIIGYHTDAVEVLLGNPDSKNILNDGQCYVYDLGFYEDFMDSTTFEITFNNADCVVNWIKVHH